MDTSNFGMSGDGDPFMGYIIPSAQLHEPVDRAVKVSHTFVGMPQAVDLSDIPASVVPDPQHLESVPSHHDRLKREADGLFAGVSLLNEMEPLEDMDDSDAGLSYDEMDLSAARDVKNFLDNLRPAPSEGIYCSWPGCDYDCRRPFPCTSRDIKAHFRNCNGRRGFQVKETSYEALEVSLEQPESKKLIADLQKQCIIFNERLHSIPDIDDFLCQLESLPDGNLKCQRLKCAYWEGFDPGLDSIKNHFRRHHCSKFAGAFLPGAIMMIDANIDLQMKRPKTAGIMSDIFENMHIRSAIAQRILDFTNPGMKYSPETESPGTEHSLETQRPSWEQLRVLRTLRAKFVVHHRQFLQRTASSSSEGLQELRKSCRRYADLLDTGVLTFKAIMNSESPSSLKEVFAFISLSYAMVQTMQARGNPVKFCLDSDEMLRWRRSLASWRERRTFDELAPLLWPGLNEIREEVQIYKFFDEPIHSGLFQNLASSEPLTSPLGDTAKRLLEASSSDENFCFDDWLSFPNSDVLALQPGEFDYVSSPYDKWKGLRKIQPPSDCGSRHVNTSGPFDTQHTDPGGGETPLEQPQDLTQSVIFMQAICFLIFIGGLGTLLLYLSGNNQICFSTEKCTLTSLNRARFSRFLEVTKFRVLNPLCLDSSLSIFHPLFRTTVKILEAGWLQTVRDVERYLIFVSKLFAESRTSYHSVVSKILDFSLDASRDETIDDAYLYRDRHQKADGYSSMYVAERKEEEAKTFIENMMDFGKGNDHSTSGNNLHPSVNSEGLFNEGWPSEPSPKPWRTSSITPSSKIDPLAYSSSDNSDGSIQQDAPPPQASREASHRKCDVEGCSKTYTGSDSANSLTRHRREKHSTRSSFTCPVPYCGHESRRLHNLRAHWDTKHKGKGMAMPGWLAATQMRGGGGVKRKRE